MRSWSAARYARSVLSGCSARSLIPPPSHHDCPRSPLAVICSECALCERKVAALDHRALLPGSVLAFHFKRFNSSGAQIQRIGGPFDFALDEWDLRPFLPDPLRPGAEGPHLPPLCYSCIGILVHTGASPHAGHYELYLRNKPCDQGTRGPW